MLHLTLPLKYSTEYTEKLKTQQLWRWTLDSLRPALSDSLGRAI